MHASSLAADARLIVGIAGVPGSGKSTLAYPLVDKLNIALGVAVQDPAHVDKEEVTASPGDDNMDKRIAVAVGLDGWHHTRAELDAFPVSPGKHPLCFAVADRLLARSAAQDPEEARRRRGAAFTFDADAYVAFIRQLRTTPLLPAVPFRTFSHALKDPQPAPHPITPQHRIVVVEGLYCLLNVEPWKEATDALDERVWVDCERAVARERLVRRHLKEGVEYEQEKAEKRGELPAAVSDPPKPR